MPPGIAQKVDRHVEALPDDASGRDELVAQLRRRQVREQRMRERVRVHLPAPGDHAPHHRPGERRSVVNDEVEHRRIVIAAEQARGVGVLVDIAVVEAEHDRTPRQLRVPGPGGVHLVERDGMVAVVVQVPELARELRRTRVQQVVPSLIRLHMVIDEDRDGLRMLHERARSRRGRRRPGAGRPRGAQGGAQREHEGESRDGRPQAARGCLSRGCRGARSWRHGSTCVRAHH